MRVVILVPRRSDGGWRDEVWAWLRAKLEADHPYWSIHEGHHDFGPFCRAAALNRAADEAGDWDAAVLLDSDCIAPFLAEAVTKALATGGMVLPHTDYCALTEQGTRDIIAGLDNPRPALVEWSEEGLGVGVCVVPRSVWDRVGGLDERFVGHSWQDVAFHYACRGVAPYERITGPLWHLWHATDTATPPVNRDMALEYMSAYQEQRMEAFLASR